MSGNVVDSLGPKFSGPERRACQWLEDCDIRGWMVDLLSKRVYAFKEGEEMTEYASLYEFALEHGYEQ